MTDKGRKLSFRLTEEEYNQLLSRIEKSHSRTMSNYIRKMILNGYVIFIEMPELKESVTQLKRIGTNLNQISKVVNSTGNIYAPDIEAMQRDMKEIWKTVNEMLKKVTDLT